MNFQVCGEGTSFDKNGSEVRRKIRTASAKSMTTACCIRKTNKQRCHAAMNNGTLVPYAIHRDIIANRNAIRVLDQKISLAGMPLGFLIRKWLCRSSEGRTVP